MDKDVVAVTHPSKLNDVKNSISLNLKKLRKYMFNSETREVIGRDGLSWAKISVFYFVFYAGLASIFIALLAIFVATLSRETPTYYSETSLMNSRNKLNPGLGFRPQIDPEDNLIYYGPKVDGHTKLTDLLKHFLRNYYDDREQDGSALENCQNQKLENLREKFYLNRNYCPFDYHQILQTTPCDPENDFGYVNSGPCVAVKLNKIYDWTPIPYDKLESVPFDTSLILNSTKVLESNIFILCDGEYGTDRDALKNTNVVYYSANSKELNINKIGLLPFYYYPYLNQPGYKSPLVFVHFENLPSNQLIQIICKAYSSNIDSDDKINLRGMAKFQLFVKN